MTEYHEGQRVRIEYPNGDAVEGTVIMGRGFASQDPMPCVQIPGTGSARVFLGDYSLDRVITVLSEPEEPEPTGMGAVVEAVSPVLDRRALYVRREDGTWWRSDANKRGWTAPWESMTDRVVLHPGAPACGQPLATGLPCALPKGHSGPDHGSAVYAK